MPDDEPSTRYAPVYCGLRALYDQGQFYTVGANANGTRTVSIHKPDAAVQEVRENLTYEQARDFIELLENAGLPPAENATA